MNNLSESITRSLTNLASIWHLNDIKPLSYSLITNRFVAKAYSKNIESDVVIKLGLQDSLIQECRALEYFNGNGCVRLLDYNRDHNALLLPYLKPGNDLKRLFPDQEHESIQIVSRLVKKLHVDAYQPKAGDDFAKVQEWLAVIKSDGYKNIPRSLMSKARDVLQSLEKNEGTVYLLHGDLHHQNILRNNDSWLAIDPKGVVGEIEFELSRFIINPIPELIQLQDARGIIAGRFDELSRLLMLNKVRLIDWTFVCAVMSACWEEESHISPDYFIKCAEIIDKLRQTHGIDLGFTYCD